MSQDIIATIDHAIGDWETSPDAMRWGPTVTPRPAGILIDLAPLVEAAQRVIRNMARILNNPAFRQIMAQLAAIERARAERYTVSRRADTVFTCPVPLPIDGHAYHRRQQARRSRT